MTKTTKKKKIYKIEITKAKNGFIIYDGNYDSDRIIAKNKKELFENISPIINSLV